MKRFFYMGLVAIAVSTPVYADIFSANEALQRGNYEFAVKEFTRLAEEGNAEAQSHLGFMYYTGEGVEQDLAKAVEWYRKAAVQGNRDAQYNLAVAFAFGEGVTQNLTEAAVWYRRAAEQGHIISQYSLGISYAYGEGVPQDFGEAARWFTRAAEQGYARAQVHMGSLYHTGEGVGQDYAEAARWYRMAADQGEATAQYNLGLLYRAGKGVEKDYSQAKKWLRLAADQGYLAAKNELATLERTVAPPTTTVTRQQPPPEPAKKPVKVEPEPETSTVTTAAKSKPLFTVDESSLLSIDEEPEVTDKELPEGISVEPDTIPDEKAVEVAAETEAVIKEVETAPIAKQETDKTVEATPETEEKEESAGFFSRLGAFFSGKDSEEDEPVTDEVISGAAPVEETDTEVAAAEIDAENQAVMEAEPGIIPTEETGDEIAIEESVVTDVVITEPQVEPLESDDGLSENDITATNDEENIPAELVDSELTQQEEIIAIEENVVSNIDIAEEDITSESEAFIQPEAMTTPKGDVEQEQESGGLLGFFNDLFSDKEKQEGAIEDATQPEEIAAIETDLVDDVSIDATTDNQVSNIEETVEDNALPEETITETKQQAEIEPVAETEIIESEPAILVEESIVYDIVVPNTETTIAMAEEVPLQPGNETSQGGEDELVIPKNTSTDIDDSSAITVEEVVIEEIVVPVEETVPQPVSIPEQEQVVETNAAAVEEEAESGGLLGFFGKLFSDKKKTADTAATQTLDEESELTTDSIDTGSVTESTEPDIIVEDSTLISEIKEPVVTETTTPVTEEKTLFDTAPYTDDMTVALLREELGVTEKLAESVNDDLSQFSVHAGRRALLETDFNQALSNFMPLAKAGDAQAQKYLGSMYYIGNGVEQDYETSYRWYRLSAEQGDMDAQYSIGNMYLLGEGAEQNNDKAAYWYKKSADQGHIAAKQNLANLTKLAALNQQNLRTQKIPATSSVTDAVETPAPVSEIDTESDQVTAVEELPEAISVQAETGIEESQSTDSGFFDSLFGEEKEETVTLKQEQELPQDEAPVEEEEIVVTEEETSVTSNTTPLTVETETTEVIEPEQPDITIDQNPLLAQLQERATSGDADAQYQLASMYHAGNNIDQELSRAVYWYRQSANQDNADAQYSLGNMYLMGEGVEQNDIQAAYWYEQAAKQNHVAATQNLSNLKKTLSTLATEPEPIENTEEPLTIDNDGPVVTKQQPVTDTSKQEAALDENPFKAKDLYESGLAYSFGDGVAQNNQTAFEHFLESAELGYAAAQYKVAIAYAYGEGVEQNYPLAAEWYMKAAEQGHMIAQRNLATMYLNGKGVEQDRAHALAWFNIIANSGNAMDVRRRDKLQSEMSSPELARSQELASQISQRLTQASSL